MRSLPSILKYFMKPKAEEYELPDEEQLVSQLEEMIRLKENVPSDDAADEKPAEQAKEAHAAKAEEQEQEIQEPAGGSFDQALSLAQADELVRNARAQAEHIIEEATSRHPRKATIRVMWKVSAKARKKPLPQRAKRHRNLWRRCSAF